MKISNLARSAAADGIVDLIDGGSGAGTCEVRTGSAPTNTTDSDSGTLLATATFSDPAFGAASSGVATASSITGDSSVDATGTPAHLRVKDSNGVVIMQGTAGASGQDMNISGLVGGQLIAGGTFAISSWTVTQPAGS